MHKPNNKTDSALRARTCTPSGLGLVLLLLFPSLLLLKLPEQLLLPRIPAQLFPGRFCD